MPLEIGRGTNPERAEDIVRSLDFLGQMPETGRWIVKLASQVSSHIFGDVWAAIAVGTICRRSQGSATVITWGNSTWPPGSQNSAFAQSLAGLTAMQMAGTVVTDVISSPIDREEVERTISLANGGILESKIEAFISTVILTTNGRKNLSDVSTSASLRFLTEASVTFYPESTAKHRGSVKRSRSRDI